MPKDNELPHEWEKAEPPHFLNPPEFKIQKGVPVPPSLLSKPILGGHKPEFPWRDMESGDYLELQIFNKEYRERALLSLRNARKSRPKWRWVWKYGQSENPEVRKERPNSMFLKVWRVK